MYKLIYIIITIILTQQNIFSKKNNLHKEANFNSIHNEESKSKNDKINTSSKDSQNSYSGKIEYDLIEITYLKLMSEIENKRLNIGKHYLITDFQTIYDQPFSKKTKISSIEKLIVIPINEYSLSPIAYSVNYTDDIIYYNINYKETTINKFPAKGKIIFRKDKNGNSADFDWRNILTYLPTDSSEHLMFEGTSTVSNVVLLNQSTISETPFGVDQEFPNNYFTNGRIMFINNSVISNTFINGDFYNVNNSIISSITSKGSFAKVSANMFMSNFENGLDRFFGGFILSSNFGGIVKYCSDVSIIGSNFSGSLSGLSSVHFENTDVKNCDIVSINSVTSYELNHGFKDCRIISDVKPENNYGESFKFGNITLQCILENKTILQSEYPILFNTDIHKTIFKNTEGDIWFNYYDETNTMQFIKIL